VMLLSVGFLPLLEQVQGGVQLLLVGRLQQLWPGGAQAAAVEVRPPGVDAKPWQDLAACAGHKRDREVSV
jgi:hypothetical protein